MGGEPAAVSTWAPLRIGIFRALWLAVLISNIGLWMQTVGAQWLLVHQAHAAILVALVQTADTLPDLLFGLVGGVLADIFDRRRLLIAVQAAMVAIGAALTILTVVNQMPPALLLLFTLLLGSASVFTNPAYQSLVPDLVPRSQLSAAAALSSISINLARVVGPAIAGLLIARTGVAAVFALNTVTYLVFGLVVLFWRPPPSQARHTGEPFIAALRAGGRFVRYSPVVRRVLVRVALFLVPGSALWALLPLVATQRLALGAGGYGLLLGSLGVGALAGALLLPELHRRLSNNALLAAASLAYAAVLVTLVLVSDTAVALVVLLAAGIAWIAVLSTMNAALQLFLPSWVRARGISVYLMVFFGSQAFGSALWGLVAEPAGVLPAFLLAALMMAAGALTFRLWPLIDTSGVDSRTVAWPDPQLAFSAAPDSGPVVVRRVYTIAPDREPAFMDAMRHVRESVLRTGATQWGLYRAGETPRQFIEEFVVPSWDEHLRQHRDRRTGSDDDWEERADALSEPPPQTTHMIATELPD